MWYEFKNDLRYYNTISDFPENSVGFVYKITHKTSNRYYIGKKILFNNTKQKLGKKELLEQTGRGRKPLTKIVTKESKIFVASDNYESIEKLIKIYGNQINFVPNMLRVNKEEDNSYEFQIENLSNPSFWIESFLDMILLSKCSTLICRTSNFSNASVCFSNTIEDVIRL
jgi:hypothetical protein